MEKYDVYKDIAKRTNGDIYIGVVGPVRSGKSTFITKFMELLVLPNITDKNKKAVATDEMPQSASGKTIMTTEPKFVPGTAVTVSLRDKVSARVRMIDCVGYLVDGALGHIEDEKPRLVNTPWSEKPMAFEKAAEMGTQKVISEHSTIGILMTTDGSITELPRESYIKAEERVVKELKELGKPFVVVLNSVEPKSEKNQKLAATLSEKYAVPVASVNATTLTAEELLDILEMILLEFPIKKLDIDLPRWMRTLPIDSRIIAKIIAEIREYLPNIAKMRDYLKLTEAFADDDGLIAPELISVQLGDGSAEYKIDAKSGLFYKVLSDVAGDEIDGEYKLISYVKSLSAASRGYSKIKQALSDAEEKGYGVVAPDIGEMQLDEPQLVKQGQRFGVKLKATAPSLHIMKVDVTSEVSPIVGTEQQSEELVKYLLSEFESDPKGIWETNMFGKSLHSLVREGLANKLDAMPQDTQSKMRKTVSRIINEGRGGVICILL